MRGKGVKFPLKSYRGAPARDDDVFTGDLHSGAGSSTRRAASGLKRVAGSPVNAPALEWPTQLLNRWTGVARFVSLSGQNPSHGIPCRVFEADAADGHQNTPPSSLPHGHLDLVTLESWRAWSSAAMISRHRRQDRMTYPRRARRDLFEQEGRGQHLLPIAFLRQLIRFYGNSMGAVLPSYLESSLAAFTRNQDELREQMSRALKGDFTLVEDQARRSMEMFSEAMRMWMPFAARHRQAERRR